MTNLKNKLIALKNNAITEKIAIDEIQRTLSSLLLSKCDLQDVEKIAKKFDNDLELIIYTLKLEDQLEAAINIINEALEYLEKNS
jgi:hypothetical protein